VGAGLGVGAGAGVGVGAGVGAEVGGAVGDVVGGAVVPPPPAITVGCGACFCFGIEPPDAENDPTFGGSGTCTGVTADGACALPSSLAVALPMPKAAPKATTTAATAIAAKRPCVIRSTSSAASTIPASCSG
jgi:hypothetical protein